MEYKEGIIESVDLSADFEGYVNVTIIKQEKYNALKARLNNATDEIRQLTQVVKHLKEELHLANNTITRLGEAIRILERKVKQDE